MEQTFTQGDSTGSAMEGLLSLAAHDDKMLFESCAAEVIIQAFPWTINA